MAHENATPRPWRTTKTQPNVICNEGGNHWIARATIGKGSPRFIQDAGIAAANAALIVEAVNAYDTLRAENERLDRELSISEQERVAALAALRLAADRLYEEGAPQAYVDDARSVLLGFTPEGDRILRPEVTPEQVAALFDELSKGPVQGGKNAQIAYAKCAKIVRSKLARPALSEPAQ